MIQPGRKYSATNSYRYGFNGKENDNEVKGVEGSQQDYGMRIYDPRLGRFLSVDPLLKKFPYWSSYQFSGNNPVRFIDLDGAEILDKFTQWFMTDAAITITQSPNSTKAKIYTSVMGVGGSVETNAKGLINIFTHTGETAKGLWRVLSNSFGENMADYAMLMADKYGDLPENLQPYAIYSHAGTDILIMLAPYKGVVKPSSTLATTTLRETAIVETASNAEKAAIAEKPAPNITATISKTAKRKTFAERIFTAAGKSQSEVRTLMNTIDYSRVVKETVLNPGDKIWRFERFNAAEGSEMHFFTDVYGADAGATGVGFGDASGYRLVTYEVTERTVVMESTIRGTKNKQFFSTELQKNIKKIAEE